MEKISRKLKIVSLCFLISFITLLGGFCWGRISYAHDSAVSEKTVSSSAKGDLRLPGETEVSTLTIGEVDSKLLEIGELATYSAEYSVSESEEEVRNILDNIKIPGTKNSITIKCTGVIKVGYDISKLSPTVDNASKKIYIAIPSAQLLDNHIYWDSIECTEKNSIFNPINFSQYQKLVESIQQTGLKQAEHDGIYDAAGNNLKNIVTNFLSCFNDYTVVFI